MQTVEWTDGKLEERFERIDERFDRVEERLDGLTVEMGHLRQGMESLRDGISRATLTLWVASAGIVAAILAKGG